MLLPLQDQMLFLKKPFVLLGQSILKEPCTCKSEINWASSMRISLLPPCFLHGDNQRRHLGGSPWFASSSSSKDLTDRQTAEAVQQRIDWKYALALELSDPGFDFSVLCKFRARLLAGGNEMQLFDAMLAHLKTQGLLKVRGRQRTDSTHILAAVRTLNRLEHVGETMRHVLNTLAEVAPEWLRAHAVA